MRYLIIGDSWGCGEWGKEFCFSEVDPGIGWHESNQPNRWHKSYIVPDTHVGIYLADLGHSYTNICKGGDTNMNQLRLLESNLRQDAAYDMIIWFHTEPVRDWCNNNYALGEDFYKIQLEHPTGYDRILDTWYFLTYGMATDIYERYRIPFTVIGGMSPLPYQILNHSFVQYHIKDWANEMILNENCYHPPNPSQFVRFAEKYMDAMNTERALRETEASERWISHCAGIFPDWGHPDRHSHKALADWIHSNIYDSSADTP